MWEPFLKYKDILSWKQDIPEIKAENRVIHNFSCVKDLVIFFQISEEKKVISNFNAVHKARIDSLYELLRITNIQEEEQRALKGIEWNKEVSLLTEKQKTSFLKNLYASDDKCIDKLVFDDETQLVSCLNVSIDAFDEWDDEENPVLAVTPEFFCNSEGTQRYEDDEQREIAIDNIKEVVVNNTRYTFMF